MDLTQARSYNFRRSAGGVLLIACGALGQEIIQLIECNNWRHFDVVCLPAKWHNTPELIPEGVRAKIRQAKGKYEKIFVLYADCGTGGLLDRVLEEEGGVERIDGPHCYSFFTGNALFKAREKDDVACFYLTDYLALHFDKLIWEGLCMSRHPNMVEVVFGNYEKLVYLAQMPTDALKAKAEAAAQKLGLSYEYRKTGYGDLESFMCSAV